MRMQRTIKKAVQVSGIGLHSGERVTLRLLPAPEGTGIVFIKKTGDGSVSVKADGTRVVATDLCTTIGENGSSIKTVEHLLSCLSGLEIDNVYAEIDSSEVPILDGSASPFISLLSEAGVVEQKKVQPVVRVTRRIEVRDGDKYIRLSPPKKRGSEGRGLTVDCTIRFEKPVAIRQTRQYTASPVRFIREIAEARTFGFLNEVEALRARGLARGGSLENAVVISEKGVLNEEGLRFADEFIRHKILDLVGDLSLLGKPLAARVEAYRPGHQLNTRLVSALLNSPDSWVLETGEEKNPRTVRPAVPALAPVNV
jgi:UDP-3-O-[3-hydroxymyristoyl] N-acetylglucosamine deacetylase